LSVAHAQKQLHLKAGLFFVSITLLVLFLLIAITEGVAKTILRSHGREEYPFMFDRTAIREPIRSYQQEWGDQLVVSYLDPHLGFAHDPQVHPLFDSFEGFAEYTTGDASNPLVIVCLGGSTTDPLTPIFLSDESVDTLDPYNWPRSLARVLKEHGVSARVLNGGVAGYSSSQELLKLLRDVIPLRPNIVISLNGVNDFFGLSTPEHPMVHRYQAMLMNRFSARARSVLVPNIVGLMRWRLFGDRRWIEGASFGVVNSSSSAQVWFGNLKSADALCAAHDIRFATFLQPILGYGEYRAADYEKEMLVKRGEEYAVLLTSFYKEATSLCEDLESCSDLTGIFSDTTGVYLDARHQNEKGVDELANHIFEVLLRRGLIRSESI